MTVTNPDDSQSKRNPQVWFYFDQGHHIGPFSRQEILDLYHSKNLSEHSKVWRKGEDNWLELYKWDDFQPDVLPPLPPIPPKSGARVKASASTKSSDHKINQVVEKIVKSDFGPSTKKLFDSFDSSFESFEDEVEEVKFDAEKNLGLEGSLTSNVDELDSDSSTTERSDLTYVLRGIAIFFVAFFPFTFLASLFFQAPESEYFVGLSEQDFYKMTELRSNHSAVDGLEQLEALLAVTRQSDGVWVSTNYTQEDFVLTIQLSSLDSLSIGEERVLIQGHTIMHEGVAFFDDLVLVTGPSFVPGLYEFEILAYPWPQTLLSQNRGSVEQTPPPVFFGLEIPNTERPLFSINGRVLFGRLNAEELAERLARQQLRMHPKWAEHIAMWEQGIQTFFHGLEQMGQKAVSLLNDAESARDFYPFEQFYARQVAVVMQGLVVDLTQSQESSQKVLDTTLSKLGEDARDIDTTDFVRSLAGIGRKIMGHSVDWIDRVREFEDRDFSRVHRERLRSMIQEDILEGQRELRNLEEKLFSFKSIWEESTLVHPDSLTTVSDIIIY